MYVFNVRTQFHKESETASNNSFSRRIRQFSRLVRLLMAICSMNSERVSINKCSCTREKKLKMQHVRESKTSLINAALSFGLVETLGGVFVVMYLELL